jgi:hypothetical protein
MAQGFDHAQGDVGRGLRAGERLRQDREFVAAEARRHVAVAHRGLEPLGDDAEHRVARAVAVDVVDLLEAVQVQHEHAMGGTAARRGGDRGLQRLFVLAPVG